MPNKINKPFCLPCKGCGSPVETSAQSAEAPTEPTGETVGATCCTRRDCEKKLGHQVQALFTSFLNSYFTEPPLFDDAYPIQVVPTLKFTSFPSVSLITRTPLSTLQVISITVPSVASLPLPPESL